ncbi:MAG: magnesium-translocating P-type ATPase [Alphaproteobacteria bacterium]
MPDPDPGVPFWAVDAAGLAGRLDSGPRGLTTEEAARRLAESGPNSAGDGRGESAWRLLLNQFRNPLVLLLLFAMALSLFLRETTDAAIVLAIVAGSALLGFWQEYRASNAVAALLAVIRARTTAIRDGVAVEIPPEDLVPGDVIELVAGDAVPADARLLESKDLFVDESTLTGESYPVEKEVGEVAPDAPLAARTGAVFQGSHVVSGTARAMVARTGLATAVGAISERLRRRPPETEFERGLRLFGTMLIRVTLALVAAIFAVNVWLDRPATESFLFALALAVGLTPELLPAIVSVTLARGAQRMAREQVIVRRLNAIENFGSMDVLCSDKTGTLTEGVVRLHGAFDARGRPSERVLACAVLNATFETGFPNPIDEALRKEAVAAVARHRKVDEVPYDFLRKRLSVVVEETGDHRARHTMITKGALRNVLEVCTRVEVPAEGGAEGADVASIDAPTLPLADLRTDIDRLFAERSEQGLRVLGVAVRDVTGDPVIDKDDEHDMTFAGFVAFEDPPKAGVHQAVAELRDLGIRLKAIAGDHRLVARRLGRTLGIDSPRVLTGEELRHAAAGALPRLAADVEVFAEIEPVQKEHVLRALREGGSVVGFLGDGINDASALHAADVGISVDGAVDVAREAADIVLLRHDLGVLARGVRMGRETFANTLKYVFITTSANFGNMLSMAAASLFLPFLPLLPKQILLNNFLSDFPSVTIATDSVDPEQVAAPRRWDIALVRRFMVVFGLVSSVFDLLTFAVLLLVLRAGETEFQTGWFIESLMTELFIVLVIRTRRPFLASRPGTILLWATLATAATTIFLPYTPVAKLFGLEPLPLRVVGVLLAITLGYLLASEAAKHAFYRWTDRLEERAHRGAGALPDQPSGRTSEGE